MHDIRDSCPLECPVKTGEWDLCLDSFCQRYNAYKMGLSEGIRITEAFNNLKPDVQKTLLEIIAVLGEQKNDK